ncbi:hypothetical protein GCM10009601_20420 [Streptomyces thermospinosisporus]|uniref:Uncharacterized protein n=1 Tax=Streptomyces thermospinosisporus TaxID=161482 RepID=A0ABP4JGY2_9ACTN
MTTTPSLTRHYERFLDLLTRPGGTRGPGPDGRAGPPARYGERTDAQGSARPVALTRDDWISHQIDLTLALGRLLTEDDVVVSAVPYELSFLGAGVDRAVELTGASVISTGTSGTICPLPRLLGLIEQYGVTALVCSPRLAARLAGLAVSLGKRPGDSTVRTIVCVGEPASPERLQRVGTAWAARTAAVHSTSSTPVVAVPCEAGALHVCERLRAEVVGGTRGELHIDGAPTGELAELRPAGEGCDCGAATPVLVPLGSTASALPGPGGGPVTAVDVERVVFQEPSLAPHFACEVRDGAFRVTCAVNDPEPSAADALRERLRSRIRDALGAGAEVTITALEEWSTARS